MRYARTAASLAALAAFATPPAEAQRYPFDVGVNVGASLHTTMTDAAQFAGGAAKFGTGWLAGTQLTLWPRDRFGVRGNLNFSDRPLNADNEVIPHVNLWSGSVDLMLRFKVPNETWQGTENLPYASIGIGRKWVNPAGDQYICVDQVENKFWECQPYSTAGGGNTPALGEWREVTMLLLGVGTDVRFKPNWAFRLELNDRMFRPQVHETTLLGGRTWRTIDAQENLAKFQHELSAAAGLHFMLGRASEMTTPVAAPPPPPQQQQQQQTPPQRQTPPPPPPPREDDIGVCILDPAAGGMRTVDARFRHASSDTVVMQGGTARPIRQLVSSVNTAGNADWYVRGAPFVLQMGQVREEFVTYGRPESLGCGSLAYVGMANGYPVYVRPSDIADYRGELQNALARHNGDLAATLAAERTLRDRFDAVRTIYLPVDAVGPRMQPLQRQEQVRKGF